MNNVEVLFIIIIVLVVIIIMIGAWSLILFNKLLRNNVPKREVVEQINTTNRALSQSLVSHEKVVKQLPTTISTRIADEVHTGLAPLNTEIGKLTYALSHDHEQFIMALNTLNSDGKLSEWVNEFREAIEPLQATTSALTQHYTTSQKVLETVQSLAVEMASVRQTTESSFKRITTAVEHWEATETTHMRDIEHRVMARLEEVADIHDRVANGLSEQQTATTTLLSSNRELDKSVQKITGIVEGFHNLSEQIDTQYHNLFNRVTQSTEKLGAEATGVRLTTESSFKEILTVVKRWEVDETTHMRDIEKRIMDRLAEVTDTHNRVADGLSELRNAISTLLGSNNNLIETVEKVTNTTANLQHLIQQIDSKYKDILSVQEEFQKKMHTDMANMQAQMQTALSEFEGALVQLTHQGTTLFNNVKVSLQNLHNIIKGFRQIHEKMLSALWQYHNQHIQEQRDLMAQARDLMHNLPTAKVQIAILVMFSFQLILTIILIYGVLK